MICRSVPRDCPLSLPHCRTLSTPPISSVPVPPLLPSSPRPPLVHLVLRSTIPLPGVPSSIPRSVLASSSQSMLTLRVGSLPSPQECTPPTKRSCPPSAPSSSLDSIISAIWDTVQTEVAAALNSHSLSSDSHPISSGMCCFVACCMMPRCACTCRSVYLACCNQFHVMSSYLVRFSLR